MAIDDIVNNNNTQKKSFLKRYLNGKDGKRGLLGKIFDYSVAIGATAASYAIAGPIALVGTGVALVGDYLSNWREGVKTSSASTRDSAILSAIWTPIGSYFFNLMDTKINMATIYGNIARIFTQVVAVPFTLGLGGLMSNYVIRGKQIKGTWEYTKKYFMENYRDSLKRLSIPRLLALYTLPERLQYPTYILLGLLHRMGKVAQRNRDFYGVRYSNSLA